MSWYKIHTVLFCVSISRTFQTAPITRRTLLFRNPNLDGRLVHNWTAVRASPGAWECAGICSAYSDCQSISFNPMSGECVIYQRLVSITEGFTISPSVVGFGVCPIGFRIVSRRCYKVVTEKLNWNSTREHCRNHNADLITLENEVKMSQFRDFMLANGYGSANDYFWCGAFEVSGGWQWINGKTFSSNSDAWCNTQPNREDEKCTIVDKHGFDCLHDARCDIAHPFVCEIQM